MMTKREYLELVAEAFTTLPSTLDLEINQELALDLAELIADLNEESISYEFDCFIEECILGNMDYNEGKTYLNDEIAINEDFSNWLDQHDSLYDIQKDNYCYTGKYS